MVAALGSIIDIGEYKGLSPEQLAQKLGAILESIPDTGMFYKFTGAGSILSRRAE
jgi:F420-non-reducing hydrogenase small subunit